MKAFLALKVRKSIPEELVFTKSDFLGLVNFGFLDLANFAVIDSTLTFLPISPLLAFLASLGVSGFFLF